MSGVGGTEPGTARPRAFLHEVHRFRGVAIAAVMLGHALPRGATLHASPVLELAGLLTRNGSVWFVFIGGLLFRQTAASFHYAPFLKRRALRLLVPYACWSLLVFAWAALELRDLPAWSERRLQGLPDYARVLWYLGTGAHLRPLWYVPLAALVALGSPLWLRLARSRYFGAVLVASVVLSLLVPRVSLEHEQWSVLRRLAHFLSAHLFGMWTAQHWARAMTWARAWSGWLFSAGCVAVLVQLLGLPGSDGCGYLGKLVWSFPLLILLARWNGRHDALPRSLDWLAEHSFTLYFAHYPVVLLLRGTFFASPSPGPVAWLLAVGGFVGTLWLCRELEALASRGPQLATGPKSPGRELQH